MKCKHINALPYRSDYLHYCIDCGQTVFVGTGALGFIKDENRISNRVSEESRDSGTSEQPA